ncbi:MAG: efflux transporter outer membrane subunit [bacterium]|nr:efflux transporter outer membrane subunit [bacterium]
MMTTVLRLGSAGLLVTMLLGCASAPPASEPEIDLEIPEAWSAEAGEAEEGDSRPEPSGSWWTGFGMDELDTVLEEALENNYDLRAAAAAVDAAAAQARIVGADLKPQVGAGIDGGKRQQVFVGLPIPGTGGVLQSTSSSWGASLNVSWEPDLWGRLRAGQAAAVADARAAEADYAGARLSLAGQAAKAWFAVIAAEKQVELARETAQSRRLSTDRIAARYRRGVAPPLDLRLARSNQAEAESALELRRRQLDGTRRQLEILLGRYPAGRVGSDPDREALDLPTIPDVVPAGLPAELVARRPDLLAAERRLEAAGFRVREARRAFYPRITLTGSAGSASNDIGDLLDSDFSVWSIAGSLLQPIFQGGRLRAAADLAESSREQALARYAQGVLRAFAEVESALAAEGLLAAEAAAQAAATEESKAAARLSGDRYVAGLGDYLPILESQRRAFLSESRLLTLRALLLTNRVDLHLALGGDFGQMTENPSPEGARQK